MTRDELLPLLRTLDREHLKDGPTAVIVKSWGRPKPLLVEEKGAVLRVSTCGLFGRRIMEVPKSEVFGAED